VENPKYGGPCWLPTEKLILPASLVISTLSLYPDPPLPTATPTQSPTSTSTSVPPSKPDAPGNLTAQTTTCTDQDYANTLTWTDNSDNEDGFIIKRGGVQIATVGPNVTQYGDHPPYGGPYSYQVFAYNNSGQSGSNTSQDSGCIP
jgi:hypothetical protein